MSLRKQDSDEHEVFEIQDYTTATDWERFVADLEEVLREWNLISNRFYCHDVGIDLNSSLVEWQEKQDMINLCDFSFVVTYHYVTYSKTNSSDLTSSSKGSNTSENENEFPEYLNDMMNLKNDFPNKVHCIARWYGIREFVTIVPSSKDDTVDSSSSKGRILLSSLALAANNTGCQVPLFVQVNDIEDKIYLGVGLGDDIRTDFEMACIRSPPPQLIHLSGLLDMFKDKIGIHLSSSPVLVSVRFTYILRDWSNSQWFQEPPDMGAVITEVGFTEFRQLPFGALSDPISELQLSATWPCISEYNLVDSEAQSDLKPSSASIWAVRLGVSFAPSCLLAEHVSNFLSVCNNSRSIAQILGPEFDMSYDDVDIVKALSRLTGSRTVFSKQSNAKIHPKSGPLPEETASFLLNYLFPDVESQNFSASYNMQEFSQVPFWVPTICGFPSEHPLAPVLNKIKSCPVDSFAWRLCTLLLHIAHSLGGLPSIAHFIYELNLELRFRWDNAILIQGITEGFPDLASCIIYQKLQMLNCCILHRINSEEAATKASNISLDTEEEFFECEDFPEDEVLRKDTISSWDKPEGRLKRFGKARLLNNKDFLYVPVTQDPVPRTEDSLEEQTEELLNLGTDISGSFQRAKIMSASLLSDMESFKAANPGAVIEDFIRWYSPRDWIENEESVIEDKVSGHLSERMLIPGNLWIEVWENAKPVPARRQMRLFNDAREAEKVLQWFSALSPGDLCSILLPTLMHSVICRIAEESVLYTLPSIKEEILPKPLHDDSLVAQLELVTKRVSRLSRLPFDKAQYDVIQFQLEVIERMISRAISLRVKFLGHSNVSPACIKYIPPGVNDSELVPQSSPYDKSIENNECDSHFEGNISSLETLVTRLLANSDVVLENGLDSLQGNAILKLFQNAHQSATSYNISPEKTEKSDFSSSRDSGGFDFGQPEGREFILRAHASYPVDHSRVLPHRLYAVILKNSFRMSGAITQDVLFC